VRIAGGIALALFVTAGSSLLRLEAQSAASLSFHFENGSLVVPVSIDGQGPFRFVLDTGSARSGVSAQLARRLRSYPVAQTTMVTPAGASKRRLTRLKRVALGDVTVAAVDALMLADGDLRNRSGVEGLVGQDVLAGLTYTIDYGRRRIVWHDGPLDAIAGARLPLAIQDGRALVSLASETRHAPLRLIPDTGADGLVLIGREFNLPGLTPVGIARLETLAGVRLAHHVILDTFQIGDIRLRRQPALLIAPDILVELLADGLLPLHLFARVTFDPQGRVLIVEAR
jgi:predicted aspartyl protease